jgi:hypothetical protein
MRTRTVGDVRALERREDEQEVSASGSGSL